jgi:uncharacterized membrane protein YeaQ/YmgE (transglycosylase-associated protein family)
VGFIISSLIGGFIVGLIARALISGPGPKGCLPTALLGIVGSFVGGFLGYAIFDRDLGEGALQPAGLLGSIIGAVLVLLAYRWRARR